MMARRRTALTVLLMLAAAVAVPTAAAAGAQAPPAADVRADFNNDGADDLAVGIPDESVGAVAAAGAVNVIYGSGGGLTGAGAQFLNQDTPGVPGTAEVGDRFGVTLASGDFDNDGFADLAVGVQGEAVGPSGAGVVNVLYGSSGGLTGTGSQVFTQVGSAAEIGDQFGDALAAGDFDDDGFADLAVGAPFEDVGSRVDAGAVSVLPGTADGLTALGGQLFTQVGGTVEAGDLFGFGLAAGDFDNDGFADLGAGAPNERVGTIESAGTVSVLPGSLAGLTTGGGQLFTQVGGTVEDFDLFGWTLASGDFDNDGFADLGAGTPFEDVGSLVDAGAVSVLPGSSGGLTVVGGSLFTQVGGTPETADWFGFAVASGDFDNDGFADLGAGAPFEVVTGFAGAGVVSVLPGSPDGLTAGGGQLFTQVGGAIEAGDAFGYSLASGDFDGDGLADLAAGAPEENFVRQPDTGAVSVLYGTGDGLSTSGGQLFHQNSPGIPSNVERFDRFGNTLVAGNAGPSPAPAAGAAAARPGSVPR